jgi:hypothetical protein
MACGSSEAVGDLNGDGNLARAEYPERVRPGDVEAPVDGPPCAKPLSEPLNR